MDFFDILSQVILSVSIFSKMGSGSQSGKLFFKRLYSGNNIIIEDGPNSLTISNTFTQVPITQSRVVIGTGDNITASYSPLFSSFYGITFCKNSFSSFLSSIQNISNYETTLSPVALEKYTQSIMYGKSNVLKTSYGSMIISGMNNSLAPTEDTPYCSLILGGRYNRISSSYDSSIIGGFANKINEFRNTNSTVRLNFNNLIVGGRQNCLGTSCLSTIVGGRFNKFIAATASFTYNSTIISGASNSISSSQSTLPICNVSIISGSCNLITECVKDSIIIGSKNSCISSTIKSPSFEITSANIIGSINSSILSDSQHASNFNSQIGSSGATICNSEFGLIIGGQTSSILGTSSFNSVYESIITSQGSCMKNSGDLAGRIPAYNSIVSSLDSKLIGKGKFDSFAFTSLIGGISNCNYSFSGPVLKHSSIIGGCQNIIQPADSPGFVSNIYTCATIIASNFGTASGIMLGGIRNRTNTSYSLTIGGYKNQSCGKIIGGYKNCTIDTANSIIVASAASKSCKNDSSTIFSGFDSYTYCGRRNFISGSNNKIFFSRDSIILGGFSNRINVVSSSSNVNSNFIIAGFTGSFGSDIGGSGNKIENTCNSGIIGGSASRIFTTPKNSTVMNTVILGGFGVCSDESNAMVVENFWVTGTMSTGSKNHFTQSFTYSINGLTGNFSNPSNITFVNGLVVGITTNSPEFSKYLEFNVEPKTTGAPGGVKGTTFSIQNIGYPGYLLVQWGDGSAYTYSVPASPNNNLILNHTYSSAGIPGIKVFGSFSQLIHTCSDFKDILSWWSNTVSYTNKIVVTGSTGFTSLQTGTTYQFSSGSWDYVDFRYNALGVSTINYILTSLNAQPTVPSFVLLNGQTPAAAPTGAGITAKNNLIANGATVVTD